MSEDGKEERAAAKNRLFPWLAQGSSYGQAAQQPLTPVPSSMHGNEASLTMRPNESTLSSESQSLALTEKYRLIAVSTSDLIAFTTVSVCPLFTFISPSHTKILGFSEKELLGKPCLEFIHQDDQPYLQALLKEYFSLKQQGMPTDELMKKVSYLRYRIRDKSGHWHFLQSTMDLVRNELLFVSKDLTEHHQIEEQLQEEKDRLNTIIQGLSIPAFFLDKDHRVVYWNKALEELSRLQSKDIVGTKDHWKAFYVEKRPVMADLLLDGTINRYKEWYAEITKSSLLEGSYECTDFFPLLGTDGKWLRFTATMIRTTTGQLIGVMETLEDVTEKKQAELALLESEKSYRLLFETSTDGLVLIDLTGKILNANNTVSKIIGADKEELIGKNFKDLPFVSFKDLPQVMATLTTIISGKSKTQRMTIQNKHGEPRHIESSSSIVTRDGKKIGILAVIRDITDKRRVEEELKDSEEKYRLVVENALEIIIIAQDGKIKFANQNTFEVLGYPKEETLSRPFTDFIHPDDQKKVLENHIARLQGKIPTSLYPFRIITKQGKCRWVEIQSVVVTWEGRSATLNFLRDITNIRETTEELVSSEKRYQNLYDNLRDGFASIDCSGRFTECNTSFENLVGYTLEELKTKTIKDITPAKWHAIEDQILKQSSTQGYTELYEKEYHRKDGKIIPVELQAYVLYDAQQAIIGYWAFIRDITARKQLESKQKENEERIQAIVMNAPIGIAVMDVTKNIVNANTAFCKILNYTEAELLQMNLMDLVDKTSFNSLMRKIADLENEQLPFIQLENKFIKKDHSHIIGKIIINTIRDKNNKPHLFVFELEDITERKQIDDALKKSEEKFLKAFNNSPIAISITRLSDGKFIEVNQRFEQLLGYNRQEIFASTSLALNCWADIKEREFVTHELTTKGRVSNFEGHLRTKNQQIITIRGWAENITVGDERCFISVFDDITELKQAQQAIAQSEKKYREFVNSLPQIVYEADENGNILLVNDAAFSLMGYTKEDLQKGMNVFQVLAPSTREAARTSIMKLMQGKETTVEEFYLLRKDGTSFPAVFHSSPIIQQDKIVGFRGSAIDISERKMMEKMISDALDFNKKIIQTSPISILIYNSDGQCISANESAAKSLGGNIDQLLSQNFHTIDSWKASTMYQAAIRCLEQNTEEFLETNIKTSFGNEAWFDVIFSPFTTDGKKNLLVQLLDITEKKKTEIKLHHERDLSDKYLNLVGTTIIGINTKQEVMLVNKKGCDVLGWNKEDIAERKSVRSSIKSLQELHNPMTTLKDTPL